MTASHDDEKLADLIDRFGHAGYGAWWLVAEIVAAKIDSDGKAEVTYPLSKWSHLMSVRGSLVISTLSKLEVTHLVTVERTETDITVRIPNLLKYRDEYTRRSGQSPESVPTKEQKQKQKQKQKQIQRTEAEAEAEQKSAPAPAPPLSEIGYAVERMYALHPKKKDLVLVPDSLEKAVSVKSLEEIEAVHSAWCMTPEWKENNGRFVPSLAKWLSDRGYLQWPEGMAPETPKTKRKVKITPYDPYGTGDGKPIEIEVVG